MGTMGILMESTFFSMGKFSPSAVGMGINGFGRIGRLVFRAASGNPDAEAGQTDRTKRTWQGWTFAISMLNMLSYPIFLIEFGVVQMVD